MSELNMELSSGIAAFEAKEFSRSGDLDPLRQIVQEGKARWLAAAQGLLALAPAARDAAVNALLEKDTVPAPQRGAAATV